MCAYAAECGCRDGAARGMLQKWKACMGCELLTDKVAQCLLKLQLHREKVRPPLLSTFLCVTAFTFAVCSSQPCHTSAPTRAAIAQPPNPLPPWFFWLRSTLISIICACSISGSVAWSGGYDCMSGVDGPVERTSFCGTGREGRARHEVGRARVRAAAELLSHVASPLPTYSQLERFPPHGCAFPHRRHSPFNLILNFQTSLSGVE
jgi:hypothetical protein